MNAFALQSLPGDTELIASIFDAIPLPAFVVDREARVVEFNVAGAKLLEHIPFAVLRPSADEALHCIHTIDSPVSCGEAEACRHCVIWNSLRQVFDGGTFGRSTGRLTFLRGGRPVDVDFLVTAAPVPTEQETLAVLILEEVTELSKLLERERQFGPQLFTIIEALHQEWSEIQDAIACLEALSSPPRRRGRPPKWLQTARLEQPGPRLGNNKPKQVAKPLTKQPKMEQKAAQF